MASIALTSLSGMPYAARIFDKFFSVTVVENLLIVSQCDYVLQILAFNPLLWDAKPGFGLTSYSWVKMRFGAFWDEVLKLVWYELKSSYYRFLQQATQQTRNVYETFLFGLSENVTRQTFFKAF